MVGRGGRKRARAKGGAGYGVRIFSMTKAIGSTAAMILMDRGKLDPNSTVEEILPEFVKVQVLGFRRRHAPSSRASQ